ncbi:uncharacterized protein A1O9_09449 [Exophiala aquamarina CBS 119918]|uniref:Uncharacterized protein n=1 Tax=Exophiala aquamarina CBS 119918 TaxID=1182545 RepID=A0A072P4W8_9EURO|nr:uncharacterized protein A1O9_09449 [Exophiala aquamarina CBS 119918]KEF54283.1 hypothetical protein A1O9_09449 [Exophiala aquamarina CBS 119918]
MTLSHLTSLVSATERTRPSRCSSQSRAPSSMFHDIVHINQEDVITSSPAKIHLEPSLYPA